MPTTLISAVDELFSIVKTVVDASGSYIGYVPEIRWPGAPVGPKPAKEKLWLRVSKRTITDGQSSLAGASNSRFFEEIGLVFVQLFCPRNVAASLDNGRMLAVAIQLAFRDHSPSGEIWFRGQRIVELPEEAEFYPINVIVQYTFKTLQAA